MTIVPVIMTALSGIAKLRAAFWQLEKDLGLEKLSRVERDVLYAFHTAAATGSVAISPNDALRAGGVDGLHRDAVDAALNRLLAQGYLERSRDGPDATYRVTDLPHPVVRT